MTSSAADRFGPNAERFGEVVEASIERLVGQCHRLYEAPPLGTLVRAGDDVFALVEAVATTALDPTRRVIARGADAGSEAEVYAEHPQLEKLLRTDVTLLVAGHRVAGYLRQYLPPLPPRIHTFLHICTLEETRAFFIGEDGEPRVDFAAGLLRAGGPTADDVVSAALRVASQAFDDPRSFLVGAGRAIAGMLAGDTARLNGILRRLPIG